ncbi:MAG: hypothetical protein J6Y37_03820 [Paludibacteraceae bacterium]|nr:hypothetical protein [Paludibacteraceae bacterium]
MATLNEISASLYEYKGRTDEAAIIFVEELKRKFDEYYAENVADILSE